MSDHDVTECFIKAYVTFLEAETAGTTTFEHRNAVAKARSSMDQVFGEMSRECSDAVFKAHQRAGIDV
jgi:hypothetical protein